MLKQSVVAIFLTLCAFESALSDTIQLKDKAAIVGTILAEKRDQVAVDVGYTILLVPRNQIAKISKDSSDSPTKMTSSPKAPLPETKPVVESKAVAESKAGFYSAPNKALPSRT